MTEMTPIRYRECYDVPRIFFAEFTGQLYLFDCQFDEGLDDYPDAYQVFRMPALTEADYSGSWVDHWRKATCKIGNLPISAVTFDPTRRKSIRSDVFERLLPTAPMANGSAAHADVPAAPVS